MPDEFKELITTFTEAITNLPDDMSSSEIQSFIHILLDAYEIPASIAKELTDEVHINRLMDVTPTTTMN